MDSEKVRYNPDVLENLFASVIGAPKCRRSSSLVDTVQMESFAEMVNSLDLVTRKPASPSLESNSIYYTNAIMHLLESHKYDEKAPPDQRISLHIILHDILLTHETDACNYIEALDSILKTSNIYDITVELIVTLFNPCKSPGKSIASIPLQNSILKILLLCGNMQLATQFLKLYNREEDIVILRNRYYYSTINYTISVTDDYYTKALAARCVYSLPSQ
jgi:hypothetical protein